MLIVEVGLQIIRNNNSNTNNTNTNNFSIFSVSKSLGILDTEGIKTNKNSNINNKPHNVIINYNKLYNY